MDLMGRDLTGLSRPALQNSLGKTENAELLKKVAELEARVKELEPVVEEVEEAKAA